ncbi:hydroxyacylglutathione hydrolase [Pasteurellaceae bacterium Macca]|nr:hydroxyacylglutathione hydrolase [Pasteurellaceae bacterium Macca]
MVKITAIPALGDNYIWSIAEQNQAIMIDPGEAKPVLDFLAKSSLHLNAILLTHNHSDHIDGVAELVQHYPNIPVYGPKEVGELANQVVKGEQHFHLLGQDFRVIESAGHTAGHISYLMNNEQLFCGDALFSGGCGRVFTGDYQAQFDALQRFKALADFVEIYPAHEYTQSNLQFAVKVLPPSCELLEYQERVDILRSQKRITLPSTIGREKRINPFMQAVDLDQFIALRQQKDNA